MVGLQRKMFEDLLSLLHKEAAYFFNLGELLKKFAIFKFGTMLGIVAHKVLGQENAGVESLSNRRVNSCLVRFVCKTVNVAGKQFNSRQKHWVQFPGQINIIVFFRVGQFYYVALNAQQIFDVARLEVVREKF